MALELEVKSEVGKFEISNFKVLKDELKAILMKYQNVVVIEDKKTYEKACEFMQKVNKTVEDAVVLNITPIDLVNKEHKEEAKLYGIDFSNGIPNIMSMDECKKAKAHLNNAAKVFNQTRINLQKEYMKPFDIGKGQVDELIEQINEASEGLNSIVKAYDQKYEKEKLEAITNHFNSIPDKPEHLTIEMVLAAIPKWANKGSKIEDVCKEVDSLVNQTKIDLNTLRSLAREDVSYYQVMISEYQKTNNLNQAINAGDDYKKGLEKELSNRSLEAMIAKNDEAVEATKVYTLRFEITESREKIMHLSEFLKKNNYNYKQIKQGE